MFQNRSAGRRSTASVMYTRKLSSAFSGTGTPLGRPVVPEVDISMNRSSPRRSTGAKSGLRRSSSACRS